MTVNYINIYEPLKIFPTCAMAALQCGEKTVADLARLHDAFKRFDNKHNGTRCYSNFKVNYEETKKPFW